MRRIGTNILASTLKSLWYILSPKTEFINSLKGKNITAKLSQESMKEIRDKKKSTGN